MVGKGYLLKLLPPGTRKRLRTESARRGLLEKTGLARGCSAGTKDEIARNSEKSRDQLMSAWGKIEREDT